MGQTFPIDRVIRLVNRETEPNGSAEVIVCFDAEKRVVLDKRPLPVIGAFLYDARYYLVSNSRDPRNVAKGEITGYNLQNFELSLPVSVSYSASCRPGNESRVASALYDPSLSVGEVLERHLTRWLIDLGQGDITDFVTRYLDDRSALEAAVTQRALSETGLDISVRLSLDCEKSLATLTINRDHMRVVVNDYHDEEQDLGIKITLEIDERRRRNAILQFRKHQTLQDLIPREVVKYVRQHVTLKLFQELNTPPARQRLAEHLNALLTAYGRKVGTIKLEPNSGGPDTFFQGERGVTIELHEYPKPVAIKCKVQMILEDIALYRAAKSPNLDEWLQAKLDRYVPQLLFGARYLNVLINFDEYEERIKRVLCDEAAVIGYHIEQLITGPDLEPIRWKEPFPLEVPSTPFETRLSRFYVNLQFNVTARIPKLEAVRDYLNRDQNVPRLMEAAIVNVARQHLHAVQPERFYMRFNYTEVPDEITVEQELITAIKTRLETLFGAEVYETVIKVAETDLIARLRNLMETICPFVVEMKSLHAGEPMVFRGNFQVDFVAAEGWERFQLLTIGIEDMRKLLEEHLLSQLNALAPSEIQYRSPLHRKQLEAVIVRLAERFVQEQFGLVIRVTNIRRDPTALELAANQKLLDDNTRVIQVETAKRDDWAADEITASHDRRARLEDMYVQRRLLTTQSGTEDEIAELDEKIRVERTALVPKEIPPLAEVQLKVLPPPTSGSTLRDLARLSGLGDLIDDKHLLPEDMKPHLQGGAE